MLSTLEKRITRHKRIRSVLSGTASCPRLVVFRSRGHIYAQLIDDQAGKTLGQASDLKLTTKGTPTEVAMSVGETIGKTAKDMKIDRVVFDRGGFLYHGRVKALADGARKAGLQF